MAGDHVAAVQRIELRGRGAFNFSSSSMKKAKPPTDQSVYRDLVGLLLYARTYTYVYKHIVAAITQKPEAHQHYSQLHCEKSAVT